MRILSSYSGILITETTFSALQAYLKNGKERSIKLKALKHKTIDSTANSRPS